jgi:hypothetical protein
MTEGVITWLDSRRSFLSRDQLLKSGQAARVTGRILGIYIFRRDETGLDTSYEDSPSDP